MVELIGYAAYVRAGKILDELGDPAPPPSHPDDAIWSGDIMLHDGYNLTATQSVSDANARVPVWPMMTREDGEIVRDISFADAIAARDAFWASMRSKGITPDILADWTFPGLRGA